MSKDLESHSEKGDIRIIRGRVDSLSLYEVTDSELKTLERGSPSSIYLNFAIFLLSVGISFLIALLSTTISSLRVYIAFIVLTSVSLIIGLVLLCLWWRNRGAVRETIDEIKQRIPSSEVQKLPESKVDS
jgi:glucan phosphoethanolaminetransferase (alkaline phosphatase superfamily)